MSIKDIRSLSFCFLKTAENIPPLFNMHAQFDFSSVVFVRFSGHITEWQYLLNSKSIINFSL